MTMLLHCDWSLPGNDNNDRQLTTPNPVRMDWRASLDRTYSANFVSETGYAKILFFYFLVTITELELEITRTKK